MKKITTLLLAQILLLAGCEASIGDKCSTSNDCPSGTVCDTDSPGGYCLVYNCKSDEECPEDATCVYYTKSISYCLKKCKSNGDCRGGYTCRDDIGTSSFCYIAPEYTYGRDESNQLPYTPPEDDSSAAPQAPAPEMPAP